MSKASKSNGKVPLNIVNHNLIIRPVDRSRKDISDWRNAHRAAESSILETRTLLYDLYDDILLDPMLSTLVDKRLMAVTNVKLRYVDQNGKDIDALKPVLKSMAFKKLIKEALNTKMWGITVAEVTFTPDMHTWIAPRKHIRPKRGVLAYEQNSDAGFSYREGMYLNTMMEVGDWDDLGMLVKAVPYVLYKRGCLGDWAQFSEIFGMPTKIGRYSGYDETTRLQLTKALDEAGSALSIVIPEEAKIELLESKNTANSAEIYDKLISLIDKQLSILILGQTETTSSSSSSGYAQSKTHAQTEKDINEDDREYVLSVLNTSIKHILTQAGFPMEGGEWIFEDEEENLSLKDRVEIDVKLKQSGLPIDDEYFYKKYSIPVPKDYKKMKQEAKANKSEKVNMALNEDLLQKLTDFFG